MASSSNVSCRNTRDLDSLGAAITFTYHLVESSKYAGPVFLGIGDGRSSGHDA